MEEAEDFSLPVQWFVESSSSQSELHPSSNVLDRSFDKPWLTHKPTDDAWLCLEPRPPSAFHRVEVGNAGSALLEMHGLREDVQGDAESDYELLLSAQQVMSVKDLMSKSNRNQAFIYDIDGNHKLAPLAAQQRVLYTSDRNSSYRTLGLQGGSSILLRSSTALCKVCSRKLKACLVFRFHSWRKIRVNCRQPFGTSEHRACIGLAYINFTPCPCKSNSDNSSQFLTSKTKPAVTNTKRKLPSWLSSSEPTADDVLPEKKSKARPHRDVVKSEADEGSNGIELMDPEQGGSLKLESQALKGKAVTVTMEHSAHEGRVVDSSESGEEQAIGSSSLKRRSPDAKKTGSKETKKRKAEKESSTRVGSAVPAADALSKGPTSENADNELEIDRIEKKRDGLPLRAGVESSHRKVDLSKEEKGRTSRDEDQVLCFGSKDEPERDFSKLLEGVVFTISGIQNPERGQLRIQGLEMGAQYRPDWSTDCTLLVCAYMDTPKFKQVQANGGSIVSKDWILECHKKRKLVDFDRFVLNKGRPWRLPDPAEKEVKRKKVNCGSVEAIRKWAHEDLTLIIDWLLQQDAKPDPEELEFTAAQGILVCLEDAVKSLTDNQGLSSITENWGFVPRAVKELAAIEEGCTKTSISTLQEAERLKGIYDEVLNDFLASSKKSTNIIDDPKKGNDEDEVDDDATEVMSDVDSQETVDYDSDETTVLDSDAIVACTHKLMERFARNK